MDQEVNVHISIRKGHSLPPLEKCTTCCSENIYHCPFCSPEFFKPAIPSVVMVHLDNHLRRAPHFGGYTIHKCALKCRKQPHFHCLYCKGTYIKKAYFLHHVSACQEASKRKIVISIGKQTPDQQLTKTIPEENSKDGDVIVITDSEEENCESGNQGVFDSSALRKPSECNQMVQTSIVKPQDCDEFYFMNLVKRFKRLHPTKMTAVRIKIEKIMFEAELQ